MGSKLIKIEINRVFLIIFKVAIVFKFAFIIIMQKDYLNWTIQVSLKIIQVTNPA